MKKHGWVLALVLSIGCAHTASEGDVAAARIHTDLGIAALEKGDMRAALRELLFAEQKDDSVPQLHAALGIVYHALERDDDALEHYRRAVLLKPDYSEAHNNMGTLLVDMGRYDEAIASFEKALGDILYATPWFAEGNLGWAYTRKGEVALGVKHLKNAVAQNPKFCRGYEWLMRVAVERQDSEAVVHQGNRFMKHCAGDEGITAQLPADYLREMRYLLAMGHLKQGESDAALQLLTACAQGDGDESELVRRCQQSLATLQ